MTKYRIVQIEELSGYYIEKKSIFGWKYIENWSCLEYARKRVYILSNKANKNVIWASDEIEEK